MLLKIRDSSCINLRSAAWKKKIQEFSFNSLNCQQLLVHRAEEELGLLAQRA